MTSLALHTAQVSITRVAKQSPMALTVKVMNGHTRALVPILLGSVSLQIFQFAQYKVQLRSVEWALLFDLRILECQSDTRVGPEIDGHDRLRAAHGCGDLFRGQQLLPQQILPVLAP